VGIILAGGVGSRFGGSAPKQLVKIAGHTVLHHSLRKFDEHSLIDQLVVVANPAWMNDIAEVCERAIHDKAWHVVPGGDDRNASVLAAVETLDQADARVLVHDSVRPLVSKALIDRVAQHLTQARSVLPIIPSADPLIELDGDAVKVFVSRQQFVRGQTPQGFWLRDLREVLRGLPREELRQYSTVFELMTQHVEGYTISTVAGEHNNLKITMPVDHMIAGRLLLEEF
jgi:2-C-methyl-D-erythritol 4-phosphate cytidylyltransferase